MLLIVLTPAAFAASPSPCEIIGSVSLHWEGFHDGISHHELGTNGQNNDYWRIEIDRVENTMERGHGACYLYLFLSKDAQPEGARGWWFLGYGDLYPGADGGTIVYDASDEDLPNRDCSWMEPGDYCANIVVAGPDTDFFEDNTSCDERHPYEDTGWDRRGCEHDPMPAVSESGWYYVHVFTAPITGGYKETGIRWYDTRTVPGTFFLGEPSNAGAPDLRVDTPSLSHVRLDPGQSFTISTDVRNQGNASSESSTLRYYRSPDRTISASDAEVGTDAVGTLSTGASSSESLSLSAPSTPGTYYYGACVDSVPGESNTNNNCSTGVALRVGEDSEDDHGNSESTATPVEANSSTPGRLETGGDKDFFRIDLPTSGTLEVKTTGSTDTYGTLTSADGRFDEENDDGAGSGRNFLIEDDDARSGTYYVEVRGYGSTTTGRYELHVSFSPDASASRPDLAVESPSVDNARVRAGAAFTLSARVHNRGDASSAATTLRYFRSSNSAINTSDTLVGTDRVGGLNAGASSGESVALVAPSVAGTYYYGACVDPVRDESDTGNNCSVGVVLKVDDEDDGPELRVGGPSLSHAIRAPGQPFTLSVDVHNGGDAASDTTTLRYYRSSDGTISTVDTEVGTSRVAGLAAGASSGQGVSLSAPNVEGTFYYGACIDAVAGEFDTGNNCSVAVALRVAADDGDGDATDGAGSVEVGVGGPVTSFRLGDLNADGYDDVLLRHAEGGGWRYYAMDGHRGALVEDIRLTDDLDHSFVGMGDLNGDGHADALLRHVDTGAWSYYAMDGRRGALVQDTGLPADVRNRLTGVGDLNGDGYDDILLRHSETGAWTYYAMDGAIPTDDLRLTTNLDWRFAGIGDFDGDAYDDVLLRHTENHQWLYYAMDGQRGRLLRNLGITPNPKWKLAGVGDFDRDGRDDVLLRHTDSGHWLYYAMDGVRGRLVRNFGATRNLVWVLGGVGDVNGDGFDDIVLRHVDSGHWLYYAMQGRRGRLVRNLGLTTDRDWVPPAIARATVVDDTRGGEFVDDALQDFDIGLPASCPREVEVCVRDHQCEDGDQVRVTVNGDEVFSGELMNARQCVTVPVTEGANAIEMHAINGTGFKGLCDHSDVNTGQIDVIGGNQHSQTWMHEGGTGSTASINVTIGGSGSCRPEDPGGQDGNDTRSGASALSIGATADGNLDGPGDVDYWRIEVPSRGRVVIESTGRTNTLGRLEDASGIQLAEDDDGGAGDNFRIELELDAGTYFVRVTGSGATGAYGLRVSHAPERTGGGYTLGQTFRDCPDCPEMVVIAAGSFQMGCPSSDSHCIDRELPVHAVTFGRPFALGKYELTFAEWDVCVAAGGCGGHRPSDEGWGRGNRPAIHVSWEDAQSYVSWLSSRTGHEYRLPSESEWEYAARAGTTTRYSWGNEIGENRANCAGSSCGDQWNYTSPVGSFAPNPWGLYDMHGNVLEWVQDCWHDTYAGAPTNGSAWLTGDCRGRVVRSGGDWAGFAWDLRVTNRFSQHPDLRNDGFGFRVARTLAP